MAKINGQVRMKILRRLHFTDKLVIFNILLNIAILTYFYLQYKHII